MNIEIRTTNVEVPHALAEHIEAEIGAAVRRELDRLDRVLVRVCAVGVVGGAPEHHVHVVAWLRTKACTAHDFAGDVYDAVTRAAARLHESVVSSDAARDP